MTRANAVRLETIAVDKAGRVAVVATLDGAVRALDFPSRADILARLARRNGKAEAEDLILAALQAWADDDPELADPTKGEGKVGTAATLDDLDGALVEILSEGAP